VNRSTIRAKAPLVRSADPDGIEPRTRSKSKSPPESKTRSNLEGAPESQPESQHGNVPTKREGDGRPRYLRIAAELTAAISSGRYPIGARLPTELELCERFGISRFTAREAVRVLSSAGLVSRRQRAGTTVIATPGEARYTHDAASVRDLFQYALDTELRLLFIGKVALDKERARQFGSPSGEEWVYAIGIRFEPGNGFEKDHGPGSAGNPGKPAGVARAAAARPIAVTRLFLNPALDGIDAKLRERRMAVYALIEREYKVSIVRVEQDLQGTVLDAEDAHNLAAQAGAPALRIVRRYFDADDRLLEVAENIHPADRFTYRMNLHK